MRALRVVVLGAAIVVICGCGGEPKPPATAAKHAAGPPRPLDDCDAAGEGWRALPTSGYYRPWAARLGGGRTGVVFANDSNNDTCTWLGEARTLAEGGYAVAVFETVGNSAYEGKQVRAVARGLRATGARRIALIGASVGARAVLQVAARPPGGVAGVVALSAERRVRSDPADLLPLARRIRLPVLSVGSRRDPLTSFGKDTRAFARAIRGDRTLILSGGDHGVDFLSDRHRPQVQAAIRAFLRRQI